MLITNIFKGLKSFLHFAGYTILNHFFGLKTVQIWFWWLQPTFCLVHHQAHISFAFASDAITINAHHELERIAGILMKHPGLRSLASALLWKVFLWRPSYTPLTKSSDSTCFKQHAWDLTGRTCAWTNQERVSINKQLADKVSDIVVPCYTASMSIP